MPIPPAWIRRPLWDAYVQMRTDKGKKHALTPSIARLVIAELEVARADGMDPNKILSRSTLSGWTGLFPKPEDRVAEPAQAGLNLRTPNRTPRAQSDRSLDD